MGKRLPYGKCVHCKVSMILSEKAIQRKNLVVMAQRLNNLTSFLFHAENYGGFFEVKYHYSILVLFSLPLRMLKLVCKMLQI